METGAAVRTQDEFNHYIAEKLRFLEAQHADVQIRLLHNTALTREVLDILIMAKSFFKVANWFGMAVKWTAGVVAGLFALWQIWKGHK